MPKRTLLLMLLLGAPSVPAAAEARLGDDVRPLSQAIHLKLDARSELYNARVEITLEVRRPVEIFRFHSVPPLDTLTLRSLDEDNADVAIVHEPEGEDVVVVRVSNGPLKAGRYALAARMTAAYKSFNRVEHEGESYVFSDIWPAARRAFPCWDEPIFKIPFDVTITVPDGHLAVTNSPLKTTRLDDNGWRTFVFERSKPLPTYDLAFAAGPLETVPIEGLGVPGRVVTMRGRGHLAASAVANTPEILRALERYFGTPYPYGKLDLVAVPGYSGAMESPGAVFFGEHLLLLDDTATRRQMAQQVVITAHELAHMWFGNLVTLAWWDDFWLNESFAQWMGSKIARQVRPELRADLLGLMDAQRALAADAQPSVEPIRHDVGSLDEIMTSFVITYLKGAKVLEMFESWLGEETFRTGVQAHLATRTWGHATAEDFWNAVGATSKKDVAAVIRGFVEQPGFPLITIERRDGAWQASQERYRTFGLAGSADATWQVPLRLKKGSRVRDVLLMDRVERLPLRKNKWFYPNAGAAGYYRWDMPDEILRDLAERDEELTAVERFDFVANAGALLWAGELPADVYLGLLAELGEGAEPEVTMALTEAIKAARPVFGEQEKNGWSAWVRLVLGPALERYGVEPRDSEDAAVTLARGDLVFLLGRDGGDAGLRRHALETVRRHLDGGEVHPEVIAPAFRLAAAGGDAALLDAYLERLANAEPAERQLLVQALAQFGTAGKDPEALRRRVFAAVLDGTLRPGESVQLFRQMNEDEESLDAFAAWVRENLAAMNEHWPRMRVIRLVSSAFGGCSAERLASGQAFIAEHGPPGIEAMWPRIADEAGACVALREREGEAGRRYLRSLVGDTDL